MKSRRLENFPAQAKLRFKARNDGILFFFVLLNDDAEVNH